MCLRIHVPIRTDWMEDIWYAAPPFLPYYPETGFSLNLELGLWPENPSNLSVSISPNAGVIGVYPCLDFYVSSGNLTSGVSSLSSKHSYLLSHLLSPGAGI